MQDGEQHEAPPPRPIDGGRVPQAIVEYTGPRRGAVTYRPASGREYRFDASPLDRRKHVLDEDLEYFRRLSDFRVLEDGRSDPEAEERERREREFADLREQLADLAEQQTRVIPAVVRVVQEHVPAKRPRRASGKAPGRSPGKGLGAILDCWMTCGRLEGYFGTPRGAYDAIYRYLLDRAVPDEQIPPRARFPSMRSDAKRKREKAGGECQWHNHPELVPPELTPQ